jgi:uncharacterized membrane protein
LIRYGNFVIDHPEFLYLLIPLVVIMFYLLRKKIIKEEHRIASTHGRKRLTFLFRIVFMASLLLALTNPHLEFMQTDANITRITVLIDESHSTGLFDIDNVEKTLERITKEGISMNIERLNMEDYTTLGNSILRNLAPEQNMLIVSDGQNNFGASLEDVSLFAASINSKLFGVKLRLDNSDASVIIEGPSKVVSEVENTFIVRVNEVGKVNNKNLKIYINDELVHNSRYLMPVELKKSFVRGQQVITAVLEADDYFEENNVYYKSVVVYRKPAVLMVTQEPSHLSNLYSPFYALDIDSEIPDNLDSYYAVILNDYPAFDLTNAEIDLLEDYVADGNGLLVVGGRSSYNWGGYNNSLLQNILPVSIGRANQKKDITNVVILMDTGVGAHVDFIEGISYFDIQKSLAVDIVESISATNKVAIIEANYYLNTITGLSEIGPKRESLINELSLLRPTGSTELRFAYQKAHQTLRLVRGSKNIVIITDGKLIPVDEALTLENVVKARNDGVRTFIIAVGEHANQEFLMQIKNLGGGEYFRTTEKDRIKLYFGDPDDFSDTSLRLYIYDSNHFITRELGSLARVYGYNSVYPKSTARLLITTSKGDPILTIWNYGLGRVAALTTDDGNSWVPDLLRLENSKMLIRTLNWLIEDPERKNPVAVEVPELRLGENSLITVRSNVMPVSENLKFYEMEKGLFRAGFYPEETGIVDLAGYPGAVNYKKEYANLGISDSFERSLMISGGEMLENDPEIIAEKLKSVSPVHTVRRVNIAWLFVIGAISIYLLELLVRRLYEIRLHK